MIDDDAMVHDGEFILILYINNILFKEWLTVVG